MTSPNTIIADMQAEIAALRKERDELLAALEAVNESAVCFAKNEYSISADAISKVEDAIAIVKSNQPC